MLNLKNKLKKYKTLFYVAKTIYHLFLVIEKNLHAFFLMSFLLVKSKLAFYKLLHSLTKFELYIAHCNGGGTEKYLQNILKTKKDYIILRNYIVLGKYEIFKLEISRQNISIFISKYDIKKLNCLIDLLSVENLFMYRDLYFVLRALSNFSCKKVFKVHDFYSICPNLNLVKDNVYCGLNCTEQCFKNYGLKGLSLNKWRSLWSSFFDTVNEFFFFSESAMKIFTSVYPVDLKKIIIKPHDMSYFKAKTITSAQEDFRIGVFGCINSDAKGLSVLKDFVKFSKTKDYKIYFNGTIPDIDLKELKENNNFEFFGSYNQNEIYERLISQKISVVFFTSICPETFSYVVSELIMIGIPIACFDIGAQSEKIKKFELGKIIPDMTNESILRTLKACHEMGRIHFARY